MPSEPTKKGYNMNQKTQRGRILIRANVHTKPNKQMAKKINSVTDSFFEKFRATWLSEVTDINYSTIRNMKSRRKISQEAATAFCKINDVKESGFTRSMLRPDLGVNDWICEE